MVDLNVIISILWFQKVYILPLPANERSLEIPRGRGVSKAKILEEKYEAKLEFSGGRGSLGAGSLLGSRARPA